MSNVAEESSGIQTVMKYPWQALVICLMCITAFWATLPYGGAPYWARHILVALCMGITAVGCFTSKKTATTHEQRQYASVTLFLGAFMALLLWNAVQVWLPEWKTQLSCNTYLSMTALQLGFAYLCILLICRRILIDVELVRGMIIAVTLVAGIQSIWATMTGSAGAWNNAAFANARYIGTFSSPNALGGFLAISIPMGMGLLFREFSMITEELDRKRLAHILASQRIQRRIIFILGIMALWFAQLVTLLMTASRGAVASTVTILIIGLGFYFIEQLRKPGQNKLLIRMLILFIVIVGACFTGIAMLWSRVESGGITSGGRLDIWSSAMELFRTHPWGVGAGCFVEAIPGFQHPGWGGIRVDLAHNDFIQFVCEYGIVGAGLLLLAGLSFTVFCLRNLFRRHRSETIWFWRGACLAVLAGSIHALVDFNLSSRPAVTFLFVLALGTALSYRSSIHHQYISDRKHGSAPASPSHHHHHRRRHRRQPIAIPTLLFRLALASILLCIAGLNIRWAKVDIVAQSVWETSGGRPDPYIWLKTSRKTSDDYQPVMFSNPFHNYLLALANVNHYRSQLTDLIAMTSTNNPDIPQSTITAMIRVGLSDEKTRRYAAIRDWMTHAHELAPLNPDYVAQLGVAELVLFDTGGSTDESLLRSGLDYIDTAASMAPNDVKVQETALQAYSDLMSSPTYTGDRDELRQRLVLCGDKLLEIQDGSGVNVISAWLNAGLNLESILQRDISPASLWYLYNHYNQELDAHHALACLQRLSETDFKQKRGRFVTTTEVAREKSDASQRMRLNRELLNWHVRRRNWEAYRDSLSERENILAHNINARIQTLPSESAITEPLERRTLHTIADSTGLTTDWQLTFIRLQYNNMDQRTANRLLGSLMLNARPFSAAQLTTLQSLRKNYQEAMTQTVRELIDGRQAMADNRHRDAIDIFEGLVSSADTPFLYRSAIETLIATCYDALHLPQAAARHLLRAAETAPENATLLRNILSRMGNIAIKPMTTARPRRVIDMLSDLTPAEAIDAQFLGGRVILRGFDVEITQQTRLQQPLIRLYWQIQGDVPASLGASVRIMTRNRRTIASYYNFFAKSCEGFEAGAPVHGTTFITEFTCSPAALAADILEIGLVSEEGRIRHATIEGLSHLQIMDWSATVSKPIMLTPAQLQSIPVAIQGATPDGTQRLKEIIQSFPFTTHFVPYADAARHPGCIVLTYKETDRASNMNLQSCHGMFLLKTKDLGVEVLGASDSALINGFASTLRHQYDMHWYLPDTQFASGPSDQPLRIDPLSILDAPSFDWRYLSSSARDYPAWCRFQGLSVVGDRPEMEAGFHHNLHRIFTENSEHSDTPDWAPLLDGMRTWPTNQNWQPCLSATSLVDHCVQYVQQTAAEHPEQTIVSLSVNDSSNWCQCADCKMLCSKRDQTHPAAIRWWSQPYWTAVQTIAQKVPSIQLGAYAYINVQEAPNFLLADNVHVMLCENSSGNYIHGYRRRNQMLIDQWLNQCTHVSRYDYAALASWIMPRYAPDALQSGIYDTYVTGIRDILMEDPWIPGMEGPLPWLLARCLWNPLEQTEKPLQEQFCSDMFGYAAKPMNLYLNALQEAWTNEPSHLFFDGLYDIQRQTVRFPEERCEQLLALRNEALARTTGNEKDTARVHAVTDPFTLSVLFAKESQLMRKLYYFPTSIEQMLKQKQELEELEKTIEKREHMIDELNARPWGKAYIRMLGYGQSLDKFNAKEKLRIEDAVQRLRALDAATQDLYFTVDPL
ncbi:MAG: DUF4838 domain-containing protein [Spartobacteria bacterium]|nr:DUF4838 domain-containing protein [Spartobacteria bacterium]